MQYIDEYITLDKRPPPHERDGLVLMQIADFLKNTGDQKNFILFNKWGAHWPYLLAYPKEKTLYRPVSQSTADAMNLANREKTINTYLNILNFTVNDFLVEYTNQIDVTKSITFYTSDHGQSIIEKGVNRTHCSMENAPSVQADVPLMVIASDAKARFPVDDDKVYSQHQMFASTLSLMGFSDDVVRRYGRTLDEGKSPDEQRWFYWSMQGDKLLFTVEEEGKQ
jgi:glucan phosphoethanolaminetransferase (alkaline phosphatase superfamily)